MKRQTLLVLAALCANTVHASSSPISIPKVSSPTQASSDDSYYVGSYNEKCINPSPLARMADENSDPNKFSLPNRLNFDRSKPWSNVTTPYFRSRTNQGTPIKQVPHA